MAIKLHSFMILMFFVACYVFSQTDQNDVSESASYFIQETKEGTQFFQRINWEPIKGIIRYEIIFERRLGNSDKYDEFLRETSEESFLEISLPAGNYRYKVLGYNVLNRLGAESGFQPFEIFQAVQPFIAEVNPRDFFLDENVPRQLTLIGERFVLGSKIYLIPVKIFSMNNDPTQNGVLVPSEMRYSDRGDSVTLFFDEQHFSSGEFRILVVNPGGLTSVYESIRIRRYKDPVDIAVSLGYAPLIPLSSENALAEQIDTSIYPLGFMGKVSFVPMPFKTQFGNFGVEISPFYGWVETNHIDYVFETHILGTAFSILYQKFFLDEKLSLNVRLGGGFSSYTEMQFRYKNDEASDALSVIFPELQAGISADYFVYKQLFVSLGVDFKFFLANDMFTTYFNPVLSVGWQF